MPTLDSQHLSNTTVQDTCVQAFNCTCLYSTLLYSPLLYSPLLYCFQFELDHPVVLVQTMSVSSDGRNLVPDNALLNRIFPQSTPASITILSQTYEVCTFIAHMDATTLTESLPGNVVVRLELPSKIPLRTVSALQQVATLAIPEVVPAVFQTGTAKAEDEREVDFSVSAFVADAVTLETVWDDLNDDQQSNIMDTVLDAMRKLQALDLADESVLEVLKAGGSEVFSKTTGEEGGSVLSNDPNNIALLGNREIGFFNDVPSLLAGIIAYNDVSEELTLSSSRSEPSDDNNGILMTSTDEETPTVLRIGRKELESLQRQAVLCHNDLEPRNLLVRPVHVGDGSVHYDLAAIIDWEMAGFFPFAYEYVTKDAFLGISNTYFGWYSLFKRRTAPLLPAVEPSAQQSSSRSSQMLFMEAMDLIQRRVHTKGQKGENVGALFRERWIQREQLVPGAFPGSGWVRRPDASGVRVYRKEDNELLEEEVLKELGLL